MSIYHIYFARSSSFHFLVLSFGRAHVKKACLLKQAHITLLRDALSNTKTIKYQLKMGEKCGCEPKQARRGQRQTIHNATQHDKKICIFFC